MLKYIALFLMCCAYGYSQSINFDQLGKEKWVRYNGGISANAVYYDGTANRQDFAYYLTGNLNFNFKGVYNIPLSFTYSNQNFNFPNPFTFNRLSLRPSYKWATAHIGDVSMTFSPYTLSGHQFTGGGLELNPEGKFQLSAMYGRFLKATEYNPDEPNALTAYKRMGYGIKAAYDFDFMKLGVILFKASDDENSLKDSYPLELGLAPKDNAVVSFESEFQLLDKAQIRIEYAISGITEDTRLANTSASKGLLFFLLKENISTNYYNALNASFSYPAGNGTIGAGYERIDPEYKTLGAYYFNNDLENITINASQTLFNNKVNLSVNAGLQQDNLNKDKTSDQQRIVSAVTLNYDATERLGINAAYSNFQSYTNIRDQFDYINQVGEFDNIDTLNYRQVSQNANLGINYIVKKSETKQHSTNLNLVYQNSNNQQEGENIDGGSNTFYNAMAGYTLGYPKQALTLSLSANSSYNSIGNTDNSLTIGPTLAIGKQFFNKQLRTNLSTSYNSSYSNGEQQNTIYNVRLGSNYTLFKKHNLSLNVMALFRNATLNKGHDLTITFGYSYAFDNFKLDLKLGEGSRNKNAVDTNENSITFRYRNVTYTGTIPKLNQQLTSLYHSPEFSHIPQFKKNELVLLLALVKKQKEKEAYKKSAINYLKELHAFKDFLNTYNNALFAVIKKIKLDMRKIDLVLENSFVETKVKVDAHPLSKKDEKTETTPEETSIYKTLLKELDERQKKLVGHRWMQHIFLKFNTVENVINSDGFLKDFKQNTSVKSFEMYDQSKDLNTLKDYLENEIIDFYYKKSLDHVNPEDFELNYINKN